MSQTLDNRPASFAIDRRTELVYFAPVSPTRVGYAAMKDRTGHRLGERELDIMQALWELGPATVAEVHRALLDRGSDIAYTTVQTMLNRLEATHCVARDDTDRAHRYRPLLKEPAAVKVAIRRLTERFFKGSVEGLAMRLVERDLTPEQLDRIQALIDEQRRKGPRK